ncbi:MAG: 23S rRNA (uracil(1939)-C(5))-methyltransferase RlmD, partial [Candidatus Firestonebacteria bacterium]|nr:23S rRNA (uracil(1939)-C(5))-methyltransferase RlmD [Candidatus Firestonebacteria bacterium]
QEIDLTIYALAYGGEGIAKHEGMVVFVPGSLPGDVARVRLTQVKPKFARGEAVKLLTPSPQRVEPFCSLADACGGCTWQSLAYAVQLETKRSFVENALVHVGHIKAAPVSPTVKAAPQTGYRHKIQIPFQPGPNGLASGFFAKNTHTVVPLESCPNQPDLGNKIYREAAELLRAYGYRGYDEAKDAGQIRHLVIRLGANTKEALAILVTRERDLPRLAEWAGELRQRVPELVGVLQNINPAKTNVILGSETRTLYGRPFYFEQLRGLKYRISADSFFQVNPFQMPSLAEAVLAGAGLTGRETVVDLYCGVGWLTLEAARQARWCAGIECVRAAIDDARANAQLNNLSNVEFFTADAAAGAAKLRAQGMQPDVVFVDPPRKGCDRPALEAVLSLRPQRLVYSSCNPVTLARDLALLLPRGYVLKSVVPVDLFPHTYHVESVATLVRKGEQHVG